nr:hypothetical protein [uncultured Caldimonas sp.]
MPPLRFLMPGWFAVVMGRCGLSLAWRLAEPMADVLAPREARPHLLIALKECAVVYLNFDVKKVQIRTDVKGGGDKLGTFKVDPLLVGVGVGMRF